MMPLKSDCCQCVFFMQGRSCLAFLEEIPDKIWFGDVQHRSPYPGDKGIRFSPMAGEKTKKNSEALSAD